MARKGRMLYFLMKLEKQIPAEVTDSGLQKRMERTRKIHRLFTAIVKGNKNRDDIEDDEVNYCALTTRVSWKTRY
ncbi:3718_t:CDS:2 [Acaulospora morrowiae]|uniref:3718_t:CDS:1 n=1 Tax=Acaulospora morrowiae TaxID=94023 RepID=A0A9N8VHN6_9GLOM|nr:3718_t:CDS:2 [Acaulospora morrowiae]